MKVLVILFVIAAIGFVKIWFLQPLIYSVIVRVYGFGIQCAALVLPKAKAWVQGRKNWQQILREQCAGYSGKTIWFHCASLGEFEQGRPVIERCREQYPDARIIVSFYSPSGYTVRKDYKVADIVTYLPLDTAANANAFIDIVQPDMVVFVKYEFWYHFLHTLKARKIPVILVSAIFRKSQLFFKWYGRLHKTMLRDLSHVYVQDVHSENLLKKIKINHVSVAYDTRFDRVETILSAKQHIPGVETFTEGFNVMVAGSTWGKDERILQRAFYKSMVYLNFKLIIAPHNIDNRSMRNTMKRFKKYSVKYSQLSTLSEDELRSKRILIMDNMGMLAHLYRFGDVNYIGGGFNKGVHNTLEAAVYGKPTIIGPRYNKFLEVRELVERNAVLVITDADDLLNRLNLMNQFEFVYKGVGDDARNYIQSRLGGTATIFGFIQNVIG